MRAIVPLALMLLTVPVAAVAGPAPDDSRRWVCVKKAVEPLRAGQRAAQPTFKCRWISRVPAVVDPTPIFIL